MPVRKRVTISSVSTLKQSPRNVTSSNIRSRQRKTPARTARLTSTGARSSRRAGVKQGGAGAAKRRLRAAFPALSAPYALPTTSQFAPLNALLPMLNDSDSYTLEFVRDFFPRNLGSLLAYDAAVRDAFWNNYLFNRDILRNINTAVRFDLISNKVPPTREWARIIAELCVQHMIPILYAPPKTIYGLTDEPDGQYNFLSLLTLREVRNFFAQFLDLIPSDDTSVERYSFDVLKFMTLTNCHGGDPWVVFRDEDVESNRLPGSVGDNAVALYADPDAYFNPLRKRQIKLTDHARDVFRRVLYLFFPTNQMLPPTLAIDPTLQPNRRSRRPRSS